MIESADPHPPVLLRREAIGAGWSDDELGRLVRAGELSRLRRGAYVNGVLPPGDAAAHALLVQATLAGLRRPAVVSHQSAAVLHGLVAAARGRRRRPGRRTAPRAARTGQSEKAAVRRRRHARQP
ncbi:MAG: type IV toxin-antitoxin system AbiEi family antitoxin domain-containing protein [Geodermatophilales bacterium]|nr:type IV toxin-antitoxin system AbiEi family antitoxin domain-containing protein [Geodermatophilales bacterium]